MATKRKIISGPSGVAARPKIRTFSRPAGTDPSRNIETTNLPKEQKKQISATNAIEGRMRQGLETEKVKTEIRNKIIDEELAKTKDQTTITPQTDPNAAPLTTPTNTPGVASTDSAKGSPTSTPGQQEVKAQPSEGELSAQQGRRNVAEFFSDPLAIASAATEMNVQNAEAERNELNIKINKAIDRKVDSIRDNVKTFMKAAIKGFRVPGTDIKLAGSRASQLGKEITSQKAIREDAVERLEEINANILSGATSIAKATTQRQKLKDQMANAEDTIKELAKDPLIYLVDGVDDEITAYNNYHEITEPNLDDEFDQAVRSRIAASIGF